MGLPLPQLAFAGLGGLAFGYDLAVVAGAGPFIKNDLNLDDGTLEAVVALAKVGACCGVVLGAISMDLLGRQLSMTAVGFFFFLGPILIAVSGNVGVLCFGRFLAGIAIGMSSVVVTAYLGEISDKENRGAVVAVNELMLSFGMVVAPLVDFFLISAGWRFMVGLPSIIGAALLLTPFVLPESPRWMVVQGRIGEGLKIIGQLNSDAAAQRAAGARSNSAYRRDLPSAKVEQELLELWNATEKEKHSKIELIERAGFYANPIAPGAQAAEGAEMASDDRVYDGTPAERSTLAAEGENDHHRGSDDISNDFGAVAASGGNSNLQGNRAAAGEPGTMRRFLVERYVELAALWVGDESPQFRLLLLLSVVNQLCASTAVINYAAFVLQQSGMADTSSTILITTGMAGAKFVGVCLAVYLADSFGRRNLLLRGTVCCMVAFVLLAIGYGVKSPALTAFGMITFLLSFGASHATIYGVLVSEVFSMHYKKVAFAALGITLYGAGAIADAVFLSLLTATGAFTFCWCAIVLLVGLVAIYAALPETSGRTLQEARAAFREFGPRGDLTASLSHVMSVGMLRRKSIGAEKYDSMIETELLADEEDVSEAGGLGGGGGRGGDSDSSGGGKEGEHNALNTGGEDSSSDAGKCVSAAGRKLRGGTLGRPEAEIDENGFGTIDLGGQI